MALLAQNILCKTTEVKIRAALPMALAIPLNVGLCGL